MKPFIVRCSSCHGNTSKSYAREHGGMCKQCSTGEERLYRCPDCGEQTLTAYQKRNRYHCDGCTRRVDPQGYYNEVMGYND